MHPDAVATDAAQTAFDGLEIADSSSNRMPPVVLFFPAVLREPLSSMITFSARTRFPSAHQDRETRYLPEGDV